MTNKITCITATYKRPKELARAIRSIDKQSFQDWEHIIVSDGPMDAETKKVVAKYKDKRRRVIELDKNSGSDAKPKNTAIMQAKGEYICFLDDDNEYKPNFMEVLLTEMELQDADVVYGDMRLFKSSRDKKGEAAIALDFDAQFLMRRNYVDFNMVLVKKAALFDVGGIDETLPRFKDWNLFARMVKWGHKFYRVPVFVTKYYISKGNSAEKHPAKSWTDPHTGLLMFEPTWFNPSGCYVYGPWLGDDREEEKNPKVAIFTITYDRLEYTKKMYESLNNSTGILFDWFLYDNGSKDGTAEWIEKLTNERIGKNIETKNFQQINYVLDKKNKGLTIASNELVDKILPNSYQLIIKVDNDVEFLTKGWLEDFVDLWKRNHRLYMGPYPEGLIHHPGGMPRLGHAPIGDYFVEVVQHISGLCAAIDARAYKNFRWTDQFLHGNQDAEFSAHVVKEGYMPCIVAQHRVLHMDTVLGQQKKYKEYFERRKYEKTHTYEESAAH